MRVLLIKKAVPDPVIQYNADQTHRHPQHHVLWTDLSKDIARHPAIIPHAPAKPQVDDATSQKLKSRDPDRADPHLLPQRCVPLQHLIDQPKHDKAQATQDKHSPVAPAAPNQLDQDIKCTADVKQKTVFTKQFSYYSQSIC